MEKKIILHLKKIVRQAGLRALALMHNSAPRLKPDDSVLTRADLAVSSYIKKELLRYLRTGSYLLIDEEDKDSAGLFDQRRLESVPYAWVIDPIDGTRAYANRMPLFGISVGLLKDLRPWIGMVYLPVLGELFYCDGNRSYFVQDAFTRKAKTAIIRPVDQRITPQSMFMGSEVQIKNYGWDFSLCSLFMPNCAVIDLCWPAIGRGCGCFFDSNIWDFAASWPIVRSAGLDLRSVKTGRPLDKIHIGLFCGQGDRTWRLREPYVLSSLRHFPIIQNALLSKTPRGSFIDEKNGVRARKRP